MAVAPKFGNLVTDQISFDVKVSIEEHEKSMFPDWVNRIFVWYEDDLISEDELLNAIKFMIEKVIMRIR